MNTPPTRYNVITVSIVDRNDAFRSALSRILSREPGIVVFDLCVDAATGLEAVGHRPPRVLLAGDALADSPQWQFVESVRRLGVSTQVIALSDSSSMSDVRAAFRAGAIGYLLRPSAGHLAPRALVEATTGGAPLSPAIARQIVQSFAPPRPTGLLSTLTRRERDVLDQLSRGIPYRGISSNLALSENTVHSHAKKIYRKLMVHSKTEAAMLWGRTFQHEQFQPSVALAS